MKEFRKLSMSDPEKERQHKASERSAILLAIAGIFGAVIGWTSHVEGDLLSVARIEVTFGMIL